MQLEDFVASYNQGIAENLAHTFEFPGVSLERLLDSYVDEHKAVQTSKTLFIEVKRSTYQWLFNLDSQDHTKFYRPSDSELYRLPYLIAELEDSEAFFDQNFSFNMYWRVRNNHPNRDFFDTVFYQETNIYEEQI